MTMEDIACNLKLSEVKQRSLRKAHETLRAQADSMIQFSVQWKELEDLFDSTRNSVQTKLQELQELKKEIDCRLADFETKELNFNLVMEAKAKQLRGIVEEVEESKSQLQSLKLSIQEHCEKCEVEKNRLGKIQKLVKGKETEYFSIQQRIKEVSKEIESKERQLNAVQGKVVDQWKEFDLKDEEIRAKQTLIEEYDREMKSKEQKPGLINKLVLEYSNAIESKLKDFNLLEKSVGVWDCKLELRELEIKRWFEKLEKKFESKVEELNLIDKRVKDCMNEVQLKEKLLYPREKHLDSLDKSIQECARRLEQQAKELELKQQQFEKSTEEHTRKQKSKEKADTLHSQVKVEQLECILNNNAVVPSPTNNQSSIIRDGRSLQVFMNEYFRMTDRVSAQVSTGLHVSSDPAKLVLDAMQGFYTSNSTVGNREFGFDLSVIRRSCIHLLKELKRVSPEINDQVREEAKKLAGDWKAKMIVAAENWLEVLGYLWLLTAYDLASTYDAGELQTLRGIAAEHGLPAERCGILDMADKAPGSVKWGPISKEQEDEVERVRSSLSETKRERKNLVTQENLYESGLLQGMAGIIRGSTKVAMDLDDPEMQKLLRESRAKKVEKGGARQAAGKRPRDDEGRVADVVGKKRALEEAHRSVMGTGPRLPPLNLQVPLKLPFGMDDVYAEGVEKMDFSELRRQKKEVNLAMHRQEVPLVNVFLEGVKSDPEVLAKTPAISFAARAQKTLLTQANGYGEMYVNMAKADKEIRKLKRRNEMAKDKIAEAQDAIKEKNNLVLQKATMAKEMEEMKRSRAKEMEEMKRSRAKEMEEMKRSRAKEVATARVEAIESFRGSEELRSYVMDQMVAMQMRWEDRVARFNPSIRINFDTSGEPPSLSPLTDAVVALESEPATGDAFSTES